MIEQMDIFRQLPPTPSLTKEGVPKAGALEPDECGVWRVIARHHGKDRAISVNSLVSLTGLHEREVRDIVSHLVLKHGKMIGSSTGNPPGFYIITDPAELERHLRSLRHRGIMCLVRAAALSKASIEQVFGQARLEIE